MGKRKRCNKPHVVVATATTTAAKTTPQDLPLDSTTINHILPNLTNEQFDKFMIEKGPQAWKDASKNISLEDSKKMLMLIVARPTTLTRQFAVYLSLWANDACHPATHLYELGMGRIIKQPMLQKTAENEYLQKLSMLFPLEPFPLLPDLKQKKHYFCLNKNFDFYDPALVIKPLRIDANTLTTKEVYYKKLMSAFATSKMSRWSECLAHCLSALDVYEEGFSHQQDILCLLIQSCCKMSVALKFSCDVLNESRALVNKIEHTWKRALVFHSLLVEEGLHEMAISVFFYMKSKIPTQSFFYKELVHQHLVCLQSQVEFNLAFQYIRQVFHQDCSQFCERDPCANYSFAQTNNILRKFELWAQEMGDFAPGLKDYFLGYCYLYKTMMAVNRKVIDAQTKVCLQLAIHFFELSFLNMKRSEECMLDLKYILLYLKKKPILMGTLLVDYGRLFYSKYTLCLANCLFRQMLLTMFWENEFQPMPLSRLSLTARDVYAKATNGYGHKNSLLNACVKIQEPLFRHTVDKDIIDYPPLPASSPNRIGKIQEAELFWNREKEFDFKPQLGPAAKSKKCKLEISAQQLIEKNKLIEQIYAFGYRITEAITVSS